MTDNEIIKVIEGCIKAGACHECENERCYGVDDMMENALDLIRRQQGRMERLKDNLDAVLKERTDLDVDRVVERLSNNYRIVHSDEDLEWNRAITKAIEVVQGGE